MKIKLVIIFMLFLGSCSKQDQSINKELYWPAALKMNSISTSMQTPPVTKNNDEPEQWLLINVWATWCAPCRKEMPLLEELSNKLADVPISIKLLSIDNDTNLVKEFVLQNNIQLPVYSTQQESIEEMLNISSYPITFLINPKGKVIKSYLGVKPWSSKEMVLQLKNVIKGGLNG